MASRITGLTIEINAKATPLVSALKGVTNQLRAMKSGLRDVDRLLKFSPTSTTLLTQKQQMLKQAITQTREKLRTLNTAMQQMKANDGFDENSEDAQRLQREIIATEQELKRLEAEYGRFASVSGAKMQAVGAKMQEVGRSISAVGTTLTHNVTMPLALAGGVAVKKFAEVDKTMQLTNKTMGNTSDQAKLLDTAMKDAAANSTFGMSDAATATLNFARAGLTAEQAAATLAPAMNLAAGEGGELDAVSAGLVATINGFHGSFNDAAKYADVFANACNNSALDIEGLSASMSVAAPIFAAAGYSVNDAALYMGVMANAGISADKAANSLKTGLARLVSPAKDGAAWMEKLGISVTNADGTMKDSVTVQKELHDAFAGLSDSEKIAAASAIFGKNQMSNWLALINTAPEDVDALNKALGTTGTTTEMAASMMGGFGGAIEKLKSSIDVAATSFGQALAPAISKIADYIQKAVDWFNSLSETQQQNIAKWALIAAAAGPVITVIGKVITGAGTLVKGLGMLKSAFAAVSAGAGPISAALSAITGPIGLVIAGITALVAAFTYLFQTNETFRGQVLEIWEQVKSVIGTALEVIKTFILAFIEQVKAFWADWGASITSVISEVWNGIVMAIQAALTFIQNILNAILAVMKGDWSAAWEYMKAALVAVWDAIRGAVAAAIGAVKALVLAAWIQVKTTTTTVWNGIKSAITATWNAIKLGVTTAVGAVKSAVSSAWNAVKSTTTTVWNAIKNAITKPIKAAHDKVKEIMDKVKSIFPLKIGKIFDGIKLPVITVKGGKAPFGIGGKGSLPSFGISWKRKAYDNPLMFMHPTVMPTANGLQGFGDGHGGEIVYGHENLMNDIREAANPITPEELYGIILAAIDRADMKINISGREFARIVREV